MRIRKKIVIIISVILLVLIGAVYVIYKNPVPKVTLSQEEIEKLRELYPVNDETPALIEVEPASLEEYIDRCDCFVLAEVVGEPDKYYTTGIFSCAWVKYEVRVVCDIWDSLEQDTIVITYNSESDVGMPSMEVGSKFMIGGGYNSETGMLETNSNTMFYVTEDGYVLSVKSEESKNRHTGSTVDDMINYIRRVK